METQLHACYWYMCYANAAVIKLLRLLTLKGGSVKTTETHLDPLHTTFKIIIYLVHPHQS